MNIYTIKNFENAQIIINKYISDTHKWKYDEYTIYIFEINPNSPVVAFLASHIADSAPSGLGGGKSFIIEFDMNKMAVIRELISQ